MINLTQLANEMGTDKGNLHGEAHNYTEVYQKYFEPLYQNQIKLLEIGIYDHRFPGASTKLWTSFFSNLELIGLDINPEAKTLEQDNVKIFIGDQGNINHLNKLGTQFIFSFKIRYKIIYSTKLFLNHYTKIFILVLKKAM